MKKIIYFSLVLFLCLTAIHSTAEAADSDKLILLPEARIISQTGEVGVKISSEQNKVMGAVKLTEWLQVGAEMTPDQDDNNFIPTAKVLIINEYNYGLDLAAGLEDDNLYISSRKTFGKGIKGHLGLGQEEMGGLFIGVSKVITPNSIQISEKKKVDSNKKSRSLMPPLKLSAEYVDQNINLGVVARLNNSLNVSLSLLDLEDFTAGLSYSF